MPIGTVAFIGLGYIGLPTSVAIANSGVDVIGVDTNASLVGQINQGKISYAEPNLDDALEMALSSGRFQAATTLPHADAYLIAVPTPFTADLSVDMTFINAAADSISEQLRGGELIVLESTVPPLTTKRLSDRILRNRPDLSTDEPNARDSQSIYFAHCPERVRPGNALYELEHNDRIIGGLSPKGAQLAMEVYASFCKGTLHQTNAVTAEMTKLTENSFRDVNIAFANELSIICDGLGIDVWELIRLANHHPRVDILQPGPGVGGHCIAVDPWFIVSSAPRNSDLIRTARLINDHKPTWVVEKIAKTIRAVEADSLAILGLTFKADIDDLRESPSVRIAKETAQEFPNLRIQIVEPNISALPKGLVSLDNVELVSLDSALQISNTLALLVDHSEFRSVRAADLKGKTIIDTKGLWH